MTLPRPHPFSAYMQFSKLYSSAKYNLATSGVRNASLTDLQVDVDALDINGPTIYGYPPLLEAIARLKGVAPESVVHAAGTSMANHLAMSALFAPGDVVLIEEPTYELLLSTATYLGAKVRRFQRRFEDNYALDTAEIAKSLTPDTRLIVLTNMHNPSSTLATEESLRAVGELANSVGARVLVDEVYMEAIDEPSTSLKLGEQFVVTSSLTKGYGLSGLRCGWILAEPALAREMWQLNDLFAANHVHIAELLSVRAIEQIRTLAARAKALIEPNRSTLFSVLGDHPAIELVVPPVGTTAFPRLRKGEVEAFCRLLREQYETSVVPGRFFERPQHFRIGLAGDVEMTSEGLQRVAQALSEFRSE